MEIALLVQHKREIVPYTYKSGLPCCKRSGIYCIVCEVNGKVYVGSAISIRGRMLYHRSYLRRNKHDNEYLQRAWNKYGESSFRFEVLKTCKVDELLHWEQHYIDSLHSADRKLGYNMAPVAGSAMMGRKHSEESREKMSKCRRGIVPVIATAAAAKTNRGKKRPEEICDKISASNKGKPKSAEHRAKTKASHWSKGPNAEAIRAKLSEVNQGTTRNTRGEKHWTKRLSPEEVTAKFRKIGAKGGRKRRDGTRRIKTKETVNYQSGTQLDLFSHPPKE